jgi:MtrB/PioB family decaheme-associated outer membrane protein
MKVRGTLVLTGILSVTFGSLACYSALAKDLKPAEQAAPEQKLWPAAITDEIAAENGGVESWGDIEFGGRWYVERPREVGRAWVTPSIQRPDAQSIAKFEEYGKVPEGAYLERLTIGGQTKDAQYFVDLRATDVGNNNQRYIFDWAKTGVISGTVSWDQIPHLYSTTAQNTWDGVGTTYLKSRFLMNPNLLQPSGGSFPSTPGANYYDYAAVVNNDFRNKLLAPGVLNTIKIGIERDKFETDNRWTPTPNWEFRGTYSTEHREGTQVSGVVWSGVGGAEHVQVPRPVDDTTQQGKVTGERMGEWAYGKYNVKITGAISTFENSYSSYTVENPFAAIYGTPKADYCSSDYTTIRTNYNTGTGAWTNTAAPPCARISLMPSNEAYTGNITSGIDLPFNSRFMNTVQYMSMRQDDPYVPTISTGTAYDRAGVALAVQPSKTLLYSSLNGEVNTLLVNNALTTRITDDLKSTLRYRYYDNDNRTPRQAWTAWAQEDALAGVSRTSFGYSYTKQNASEDLTYHVMKNVSVGGSAGWERIDRDGREALRTDEYIGKIYGDARWNDIGQLRASYQYSERRYDRYDPQAWYSVIYPLGTAGTSNNWGERKFDLANRDRDKANVLFSFDNIPFFPNLALTPSAGLKNDHYLTDPNKAYTRVIGATTSTTYEMGLLKDNSWNAGLEAAYTFKPGTSVVLAYVRENFDRDLVGSNTLQNTATGAIGAANSRWGSNMKEDVDTFIVGANIALNDQFDFSASYSIALGKEDWTAYDLSGTAGNSACLNSTNAALGCRPFPTVNTNLQRVDAVLKYKFDSETVNKFGFQGDVSWKLKYSWDHTRVDNWQNDLVTPYMYLVDNSSFGRNVSMAAFNPNYDVHVVGTSINFKW